jgi:hypothetical protein
MPNRRGVVFSKNFSQPVGLKCFNTKYNDVFIRAVVDISKSRVDVTLEGSVKSVLSLFHELNLRFNQECLLGCIDDCKLFCNERGVT